jgi:glutamate/tyrosine decarboxylase-like PLP-dependent enzyme
MKTHKTIILSLDKLLLYYRADSVVWNPHKLLAAPQQCSVLLVRHPNIIKACHACNAAYLFQKDKFYDSSFDLGDKYLQCGRRADVFKFWFMWKAKVILFYTRIFVTTIMIYNTQRYFCDRTHWNGVPEVLSQKNSNQNGVPEPFLS